MISTESLLLHITAMLLGSFMHEENLYAPCSPDAKLLTHRLHEIMG